MSRNNISFILNKPQLSENIGACARAIKNFNFKKLVLINPKPIFPNDKILATSVGAKDIIKQSKKYDNLDKALGKIDIVIATPFWRKGWFWMGIVTVVLFVVILIIRNRFKQERLKSIQVQDKLNLKNEVLELKQKALQNIL